MSAIDKEFLYTFKIQGAEYKSISMEGVLQILFILGRLKLIPKNISFDVRNRVQFKRVVFDICYRHRNNLLLFKEIKELFNRNW